MVSKKAKLIFLMPPKTASNSLTECLLDSSINFEEFDESKPKIHLYLSELVNQFQIKNLDEYKVIQVTRNPYHKFVSSYFHQMRMLPKDYKGNLKNLDIEEFSSLFWDCFNSNGDFFKKFYGETNFIWESLKKGKTWSGLRLYLAQYQWNDMKANVKYFKIEDLTTDITPLSKELGIYLPELEYKNVNKKLTDYDYTISSSRKIKSIIDVVYHNDFKILGY